MFILGMVISRLKMVTTSPVKFRIISIDGTEEDAPLFNVDPTGQLTLSGKLDREVKDMYIISVLAETDSSPPLSAVTDITLKVLDENDNAPEFESSPYRLDVAENIDEGTSILKG
jgi:protocadherin Fat 1/2/3